MDGNERALCTTVNGTIQVVSLEQPDEAAERHSSEPRPSTVSRKKSRTASLPFSTFFFRRRRPEICQSELNAHVNRLKQFSEDQKLVEENPKASFDAGKPERQLSETKET